MNIYNNEEEVVDGGIGNVLSNHISSYTINSKASSSNKPPKASGRVNKNRITPSNTINQRNVNDFLTRPSVKPPKYKAPLKIPTPPIKIPLKPPIKIPIKPPIKVPIKLPPKPVIKLPLKK